MTGRMTKCQCFPPEVALPAHVALNQPHVFRALSAGYAGGITRETASDRAKPVLQVCNFRPDLWLWTVPRPSVGLAPDPRLPPWSPLPGANCNNPWMPAFPSAGRGTAASESKLLGETL